MKWINKINKFKVGDRIRLLGTKEGSTTGFRQWFKERKVGDICVIKEACESVDAPTHYFVQKLLTTGSLASESSGYLIEQDFERVI